MSDEDKVKDESVPVVSPVSRSLQDALAAFDNVQGGVLAKARVDLAPVPAVELGLDDDDEDEESDEEAGDEGGDEDEGGEDDGPFEDEQIEALAKGLRKLAKRVDRAEGIVELRALLAQGLRDIAESNMLMLAYAEPSEDEASPGDAGGVDFVVVQRALMTATTLLQFIGESPDVGPGWKKMLQGLPEQLRAGLERGRLALLQQLEAAYREVESKTGVGFEAVARADGVDPAAIRRAEEEARRASAGG